MKDSKIIVTGSSGYIGSNFLNTFPESIAIKNSSDNTLNFIYKDLPLNSDYFKNTPIVIIHLATYFSLNENENDLIKSKFRFWRTVIKLLKDINVKK